MNNLVAGYTKNEYKLLPRLDGTSPLPRSFSVDKNSVITIRYFNELSLPPGDNGFSAVITSGAEYKKYSALSYFIQTATNNTYIDKDPDNENYGAFVQANPSWKNIHLTLGMRYENNKLFGAAWSPRLELTTNFNIKSLTIKPKISWGRGITAPTYENRFGDGSSSANSIYGNPNIKPQSQQGFDYGVELFDIKGRYQFEITYYDNVIKDLISLARLTGGGYVYTNVGSIANVGWEFSGTYRLKRFSLQATLSIMNSTVKDTTGTTHTQSPVSGQAPGKRGFFYPRHTAGVNLTYNFFRVFGKTDKAAVSLSLTELDGVKSIDPINYQLDVAYGRTP